MEEVYDFTDLADYINTYNSKPENDKKRLTLELVELDSSEMIGNLYNYSGN
jgi:hypothetical protein